MQATSESIHSQEKKKSNTALTIILAVLLIAAIVSCIILFTQQKNQAPAAEPGMSNPEDDAKIVKDVSKIMILPEETPSMATVLDVTKLSDQPFFKNAQNGDKLMLFTGAQKAILYRPSTNQIVETMPLIMDQNSQATETPTLPQQQ